MKETSGYKRKADYGIKVVLFFVLTIVITWLLWLTSLLNVWQTDFPQPLLIFGQFATLGPLIAALIMLGVFEGRKGIGRLFRSVWRWRFKKRWLVVAIAIPFVLAGLAQVIRLLLTGEAFEWGVVPAEMALTALMMLFVGGPLEEFGWRGYALPLMLKKCNALTASLVLGVVHGLWHLPLHFMPDTVQSAMPVWEFIAVTAVGAIVYTWIYIGTNGSLGAIIIHHWAGNIAASFFVYWHSSLGRYVFFGLQLLLAIVIVIIFKKDMLRRKTVDLPSDT